MPTSWPRMPAGRGTTTSTSWSTPGVFADGRWFDVLVEYAKAGPDDILVRIGSRTWARPGPDPAPAHALVPEHLVVGPGRAPAAPPARTDGPGRRAPEHRRRRRAPRPDPSRHRRRRRAPVHRERVECRAPVGQSRTPGPYVKDAFHRAIIDGDAGATNPEQVGSKAASQHRFVIEPGASQTLRLRLRLGSAEPRWPSRPTRSPTSRRRSRPGSPRPTRSTRASAATP